MPKKLSREAQTARYYRRRRISRICTFVCGIVIRMLAIGVTAVCAYLVFFDAEAITLKGIAAAALFVLLYAQCASFSMLGLRLFSRRETRGRGRLALSAVMICAPLYFVVLVISIIPLTERAAFFLTVFPAVILNVLPMESVRDEFSLRGFPSPLFWGMQILMQTGVFAVGQLYGQYLLSVWG